MPRLAVLLAVTLAVVVASAATPLGVGLARAQQAPPPCGVRTRSPPTLTRYDQLVPGARYLVRLRYDRAARTWMPAPALAMPLHHASSLEYVGYTLPAAGDYGLELEVTALARRLVRYDDAIHTWFFTYRVRVRGACSFRPPA